VASASATAVDKIEALMTTTRRHFLDTAAGDSGVTLSNVPRQLEPGYGGRRKVHAPKGYSAHFEHHRNFIAAVSPV